MQIIDIKQVRVFGFIWAAILVAVFYFSEAPSQILLYFAGGLMFVAAIYPMLFVKIKIFQLWMKIGQILGWVNTRIILFILFFVIFTPIAIFRKAIGKQGLDTKLDSKCESYFINRETQPTSMKYRF